MNLFSQVAAAVLLLSLSLCLQCAGVTTHIEWLKPVLTRDIDKHGPTYSATIVVKSTVAIVLLHGLAILLWAGFYRSRCFSSGELAFFFSASSYSTVGYSDLILPSNWRLLGPLEDHRCVDVWNIGQCSVRARHPVARSRHTSFAEEFN